MQTAPAPATQTANLLITLAGAPQRREAGRLAGTSSFGMSGVNAHMFLALPAAGGPWRPLTRMHQWKRERFYPLPEACHLAAGVSCPSRSACVFCFRPASPATAFLAEGLICGQLVLPASALLEAATAAVHLLGERDAHAALLGVTLPVQAVLPEQPSGATFTCSVSLVGAISVEEAPNGKASRVILGAVPAVLGPPEQAGGICSMQKRPAMLQVVQHSSTGAAPEQAACTASMCRTAASTDGFLCCPSFGAAALDMLSPALTSSCTAAPTVLSAAESLFVSEPLPVLDTVWAAASVIGAAGQSAPCKAQVCSTALQLWAPAFQRARRAKQEIEAAAVQLLYDVEWQASNALEAQACSAPPAGKPPCVMSVAGLHAQFPTTSSWRQVPTVFTTKMPCAAHCRQRHPAALERCKTDQPGRRCSSHSSGAAARAAAAQGKGHAAHQPAERRPAQHRIAALAGGFTGQRSRPCSGAGRQQVPAL